MSWLWTKFYDKIMRDAEQKCLGEWRAALLGNVSNVVLEIGCGTGANLDYYPEAVNQLILVEPDKHMRRKLQEKIASKPERTIKVLDCSADSIPLADSSCDVIVSTLVLCSVPDQAKVLAEMYRLLRPEGKFIFIEHMAANTNPQRLKWQRRLEPFWKWVTSGCCLTRQTEEAISKAGFVFEDIARQSMRGVPAITRPSIKGVAFKAT